MRRVCDIGGWGGYGWVLRLLKFLALRQTLARGKYSSSCLVKKIAKNSPSNIAQSLNGRFVVWLQSARTLSLARRCGAGPQQADGRLDG